MVPFILRRLIQGIPTLLLCSIVIFFVISLAPGDFLTPAKLNPGITQQQLDNLARNFGLDKSPLEQYLLWFRNMLTGDLGLSFMYQAPVQNVIWSRIGNSMWLVVAILFINYAVAIPLGVYGAVKQNTLFDRVSNVFVYFMLGFPSFFLALIALYLLVQLQFATGIKLPIGGMTSDGFLQMNALEKLWDILKHIAIPALLVGIQSTAGLSRFLRALTLEVLNSDYIRTARAKGVSERSAIWKHTVRNAILPLVAGLGGTLPGLIGGAGFIEVVFAYPGITPMLLDALAAQDLYLIAGFTMVTTVLLVLGNIVADILTSVVDPRVKAA